MNIDFDDLNDEFSDNSHSEEHENDEVSMAKADLHKLIVYSSKLSELIQGDQNLEAWVQAKITKAADYISSVFHYMEYEMKSSEYGDHLENVEMYNETIKWAYEKKLYETVARLQEKKKIKEAVIKTRADKKAAARDKNLPPEPSKRQKDIAAREVEKNQPAYARKAAGKSKRTLNDLAKNDKQNPDDKPLDEVRKAAVKPSKGMTAKEKSSVVKKAKAGKDIGAPGKNFAKIAQKAGGGEKGKRIAGAVMWKKEAAKVTEVKLADKDYDKDGKIETPKDEVMGSRMRAAARAKSNKKA